MNQQLTQAEMAAVLSVSAPTMHKLVQRGMPHWKVGSRYRFDPDEVQAWLRREDAPFGKREKRSLQGQQSRRKRAGAAGGKDRS